MKYVSFSWIGQLKNFIIWLLKVLKYYYYYTICIKYKYRYYTNNSYINKVKYFLSHTKETKENTSYKTYYHVHFPRKMVKTKVVYKAVYDFIIRPCCKCKYWYLIHVLTITIRRHSKMPHLGIYDFVSGCQVSILLWRNRLH